VSIEAIWIIALIIVIVVNYHWCFR